MAFPNHPPAQTPAATTQGGTPQSLAFQALAPSGTGAISFNAGTGASQALVPGGPFVNKA